MNAESSVLQLVQTILREDPRVGIVLAEILGPPLGLRGVPAKPWDET